ncbi:HAD-IA family hydrolase [Nostocoides sp. F2B08]|uniref:HAD-IA family hydrolase n=1 Tax=Nostocoides sp. F2B08 TaxID=2653936 RepID=UPI001262EDA9|nr:HAD-IA family hydrolase [Tetrasphaera sp. F2B08]KAB7745418.1 HAD-IA family hydrolase [Tetrasphaera sp. F2B08]
MIFEVDAILFDIDGTLVDSTGTVERTWRAWAAQRGLPAEDILAVCHGRRTEDTVAEFLPAAERATAVAELERLELDDLEDVVPLPAAFEILSLLPADRWAAVTSGSGPLMRARLEAAGLPVPRVLVAAEDVSAGKPDPQGYRRAADGLGVDARRCLVVEDAPAGLAAGHAAGASVLAVATSHPAEVLTPADAVVADLRSVRVGMWTERLTVEVTGG